MALVLVNAGMVRALDALTATWSATRFVGLFQNDWQPVTWSTIGEVVPANFSGYAGLQTLAGWTAAVLSGQIAVSQADPVTWSHDGGPAQNWIYGYYVVDGAGVLQWAERNPDGGYAMSLAGNVFQATPRFSICSCFTSTGGTL